MFYANLKIIDHVGHKTLKAFENDGTMNGVNDFSIETISETNFVTFFWP